MSVRSVLESLIPLAVEEVKPAVEKLWHVITGQKDDTSLAQVAKAAGKDVAGLLVHYAEQKLSPDAVDKIKAQLGTLAAGQSAWAIATEMEQRWQRDLENRQLVIKELEQELNEIRASIPDLAAETTTRQGVADLVATKLDLERQVLHFRSLLSGGEQ